MKQLFTYILIFFSTLLLFNCKKYPEGGCERRGPKNIIGNWKLTMYEVNGIDSTELINYNGNDNYKKNSFVKHSNGDKEIIVDSKGSIAEKINFKDKNEKIEFYTNDQSSLKCISGYCYRNYFLPEGTNYNEWKIIKLTKTEIVLTSSQKNIYKIKLSK